MRNQTSSSTDGTSALAWEDLPAVQQPQWRQHPAYARTRQVLTAADPLVSAAELRGLRAALAAVAGGAAHMLQLGDCAESFYECTESDTNDKLGVLDRMANRLDSLTNRTVVRVGRIGGQFAKPRSQPTERFGDQEIPAFRGHLVNSEVPTPAARQHDPRRMLWAYEASGKVVSWTRAHRELREQADAVYPTDGPALRTGPWCSHEALVIDYEGSLVRVDPDTGETYLSSTHLPWIGMRTLQPDAAHVHLLASVVNPVGCKIGPSADPETVVDLCRKLDPDRVPGRLLLIARMGRDAVREALPPLVSAVRNAGHPAVWLTDPMHGNTVKTASGIKTRHLADIVGEAVAFREIVESQGQHAAGLHLEVASADVTECVGGLVRSEDELSLHYTSLCDPRLNLDQALELLEAWA